MRPCESAGEPGRDMVVTIDGPAGAGKSTVARRLAERLGFAYVNSGAIYRAIAWRVSQGDAGRERVADSERRVRPRAGSACASTART